MVLLKSTSSSQLISSEEFKLFHELDRKLYTLLTKDLLRDPLESMKIMSLWLWMERSGLNNVIKRIFSFPNFLINELADEAMTCINFLNNNSSNPSCEPSNIPLTHSLMDNELTIQYIRENRLSVTQGMTQVLNEVCLRAMTDLMEQALERNAMLSSSSSVVRPGFTIGADKVVPWIREVRPDDRTMFVTFSRGYPVAEREIKRFFTRIYGDCIESLHMQEVQAREQSLFAKIVFRSASSIEMILNGAEKAKFVINGKHVWMRKYVPRGRGSSLQLRPL